jgi:hypothetical protein
VLWLLVFSAFAIDAPGEPRRQSAVGLVAAAGEVSPYAGRNGAAEARDAEAAGEPFPLYSHVFNGRAPGFRTPGLRHCHPGWTGGRKGPIRFLPLPEADWGEPGPISPMPPAEAAIYFATDFNREMFRRQAHAVRRVCPKAALDPYQPDKELYYSALLTGAFNELRCRGYGAGKARKIYEQRFGARERAIRAALLRKYGPPQDDEGEAIAIGFRCPHYRGAGRRFDVMLRELERRLLPADPPGRAEVQSVQQ